MGVLFAIALILINSFGAIFSPYYGDVMKQGFVFSYLYAPSITNSAQFEERDTACTYHDYWKKYKTVLPNLLNLTT